MAKSLIRNTLALLLLTSVTTAQVKKVVCYFPSWATYRKGDGKFSVKDIDPNLCTHLIYSFALLDDNSLLMKSSDSYLDIDSGSYRNFTSIKSRSANGLKTLIAIGGWTDSQSDKYSRLVSNPNARQNFINQAVKYMQDYGFDGLDLDWEYPKTTSDKAGFTSWIRELSQALKPRGLMLTAAVSPSKATVDAGYDIPSISQYLDQIHLMAYDYHGSWEPNTADHHSPLYKRSSDTQDFNTDASVRYWIDRGTPKDKLVVGIPTYGRTWKLSGSNTIPPASAAGSGNSGQFTGEAGILSYQEICQNIKTNGWTVVEDSSKRMGPYAFKGDQWVGYDSPTSAKLKADYINSQSLGGAMFWDISMDDFRNGCGGGNFPIIRAVKNAKEITVQQQQAPQQQQQQPLQQQQQQQQQAPQQQQQGFQNLQQSAQQPQSNPNVAQPSGQFRCPGDGVQANPSDCSSFYNCAHGTAYKQACPSGLKFNRLVKVCDWPYNVKC